MFVEILRVETETKVGMYRNNSLASEEMHEMSGRHPAPFSDTKIGPYWNYRLPGHCSNKLFGFTSIEQLRFWIYKAEWRESLHDEGYAISYYEVPEEYALLGDTQAIFVVSEARLVKRVSFKDLD